MKVLIYYDKKLLKPVGGPTGYLYNLYSQLKDTKVDFIDFLDEKESLKKKIFQLFPNSIKKKIRSKRNKNRYIDMIYSNSPKISSVDLNKYDIVHFHSSISMFMVKESLKDYKGIVLFTTHTPKVTFKEIIEDTISNEDYINNKEKYDGLEKVDEYAFNRADYIIFPCEEAEECYFNTWDKYDMIKKKNEKKYLYLTSSIRPAKYNVDREKIRNSLNIPSEAFVVSYIGRHNVIKGYENLKSIGQEILKRNKNVYFLIAGKEEPIKGLDHNRWIEIGWTTSPHDYVNASDIFVLPNKETYFDLVFLEVLSLGKKMVVSNTGGNKYFKKFNSKDIYYYEYDDINHAVEIIENIMKDEKRDSEDNYKIFENNFTMDVFLNNYIDLLKKIYKE